MNKDNFCIAPFIQLQVSQNGQTGPCPYTVNFWKLDKLKTIKEKWNSKELEELRNSFLSNDKNKICNRCWRDEDAGKKSLRQRLNNFGIKNDNEFRANNLQNNIFKKYISTSSYKKYPKILTLIPGNECNLACVTCGPGFSSKWTSELKHYAKNNITEIKKNWNMEDKEYKDIVENSQYLQKIELFGGEPFYNKKNRELLIEKIIEKGTSKNITLYFNTNGTQYNEKYLNFLTSNFKKLEIRVSIDGINEQFEYLRYGATYKTVIENSKKFNNLQKSNFEIICTVSPYNFLYLEEYDEEFKKYGWSVFYNLTSWPSRMMLFNIPDMVKKYIKLPVKFKDIENYINNKNYDPSAWQEFVDYTKLIDKNRALDMPKIFPKFYELVKKYGFEQ
jgi:radical SAM protein with 4Fe4S-binding SPASM domain